MRRSACPTAAGQDEYWNLRQYDAMKAAIADGVSVLWLTGNAVFAVSNFYNSSGGAKNRIITRDDHFAGLEQRRGRHGAKGVHGKLRTPRPDESLIIGARSIVPFNGGDWICTKPEHWIFEGTGMKKGDHIPSLVGWEHHGAPAKIPGHEVAAEGTRWKGGPTPAHWIVTIFPGPKNNFVLHAATIFWPQGMSTPPGHMFP